MARSTLAPRRRAATLLAAALVVGAVPVAAAIGAAPAAAAPTAAPLGIAAGGLLPYASQQQRDAYLSSARDLGATWLRFDMTWNDIQRSSAPQYDWRRYDTVVADAQRYGLQVMGLIGFAPTWAQHPSCVGANSCKPRSAEEYGRFAGAAAAHFAPRGVHHWEIWNEPNSPQWFAPAADPALYAGMLRSAYREIHAADPRAVVISGGPAPAATGGGSLSPIDFLSAIYANGGGDSFDVLGAHPYCFAGTFDCPKQTEVWNAWSQMDETQVSLRSVMAANGDGNRKIWATEYGAPTGGSKAVTEAHQARMLVESLQLFGAESWSGPLFVHNLRDLGTNPGDREHWFGVLRYDGSRKPAYDAVRNLMRSATVRQPGNGGGGEAPAPAPQPAAPARPAAPVAGPGAAPAPTLVPPVSTARPVAAPPAPAAPPAAPTAPVADPPPNWWEQLLRFLFG